MGMGMKIVVLTHLASPYQVELFDAVAGTGECDLVVYYIVRTASHRFWIPPHPRHRYVVLEEGASRLAQAKLDFAKADLAVFNFYNAVEAAALLSVRVRSGMPWVFWGERPGFINATLGRFWRLWCLRALHRSQTAIWGIGQLAVDAYRSEFGLERSYENLPYCSNLSRLKATTRSRVQPGPVFVFSGSFTQRKGVDLLAEAFVRIAGRFPGARLRMAGAGPLEGSLRCALDSVSDRVEWMGFVQWERLCEVYAAGDFFCMPSRHDGWGLVVPEALAAGLPVISTKNTGAAVELVRTGENGWVVPADDLTALEQAMSEAAQLGDAGWKRMSQKAVESVACIDTERGADRFMSLSRKAVSEWAPGAKVLAGCESCGS